MASGIVAENEKLHRGAGNGHGRNGRSQAPQLFVCSHSHAHHRIAARKKTGRTRGGRNRLDRKALQRRSVDCGPSQAAEVKQATTCRVT
jgi:hypothetical protein